MTKRVLVIDDHEDFLEILAIIFRERGYEIVVSTTRKTAGHISQIHPDIVLLDVRISGSDKGGAEICKEIKSQQDTRHLPVLLISGETDLDLIAQECGANAFLTKPFDVSDLLATVEACFIPGLL